MIKRPRQMPGKAKARTNPKKYRQNKNQNPQGTKCVLRVFSKKYNKYIDVRKNVRYNYYDIKNLVIQYNDKLEEIAII